MSQDQQNGTQDGNLTSEILTEIIYFCPEWGSTLDHSYLRFFPYKARVFLVSCDIPARGLLDSMFNCPNGRSL